MEMTRAAFVLLLGWSASSSVFVFFAGILTLLCQFLKPVLYTLYISKCYNFFCAVPLCVLALTNVDSRK